MQVTTMSSELMEIFLEARSRENNGNDGSNYLAEKCSMEQLSFLLGRAPAAVKPFIEEAIKIKGGGQ
jgi:hypothetical protein